MRQAALGQCRRRSSADQELVHGSGALATGSDADSVYRSAANLRSWLAATSVLPIRVPIRTAAANVRFTLTNEAGDKFWDYTSANVGKSMAVVMGGRVREVANIKSAIRDSGEIEGSFSPDEVEILSKMLRTGALPASLNYLEDRTVGASLGADSIRQGVTGGRLSACWSSWPSCSSTTAARVSTPTWRCF